MRGKKVTIPYDTTFVRGNRHYSYLYYGMSFAAAIDLAKQKGYTYVGSNCQNTNAFFVRNDLKQYLEFDDMDISWQMTNVRESRDEKGNLTYLK